MESQKNGIGIVFVEATGYCFTNATLQTGQESCDRERATSFPTQTIPVQMLERS
jgi:hypothetical protein